MIDPPTRPAAALLLMLLASLSPVACKQEPAATTTTATATATAKAGAPTTADAGPPGTVPMRVGRETFHLEVADSREERQRGLMYRYAMPDNLGMIFVFDAEDDLSFFMKNTYIPLDIIYLDGNGAVVAVKPMKPRELAGVTSDRPAQYAVELNQGAAARAGVRVGDVLEIPSGLKAVD